MKIINRHEAFTYLCLNNNRITSSHLRDAMAQAESYMKNSPDTQSLTTAGFHITREDEGDDEALKYWVDPGIGTRT